VISAPFLFALALTLVALAGVIWTGLSRRRPLHYTLIVVMLGLLSWAIYEAEIMGQDLTYEGAAATFRKIHFGAVALTFLTIPVLLFTGVRVAKQDTWQRRRPHRLAAYFFVGIVVITATLGTAMTVTATQPSPLQDDSPLPDIDPGP
jgi:sulfite exporter TauE/SafE